MRRLLFHSLVVLACGWSVPTAVAQTWSNGRGRPALFEIISVDPSGEADWPYGQEDPAGDGIDVQAPDEASIDLRTLYADADDGRLWLRAHVVSEAAPVDTALAFFFIDSDRNASTGGAANDTAIFRSFELDPTDGGYEYAIGINGRGQVVDSFAYESGPGAWMSIALPARDVNVEVGVDRDPIALTNRDRGYFQIDLDHGVTGLNARCEARIFVRLHNDDPPERDFGDDDDDGIVACRPDLNELGDPVVLRTDACERDAECPAAGRCRSGICIFEYVCNDAADCRADQQCQAGRCVVVVDQSCADDSDCDGLVCDDGQCTACTASGATACGEGMACTSVGRCVEASDLNGGGSEDEPPVEGEVRGGAFTCSIRGADGAGPGLPLLVLSALCLCAYRRRGRQGRQGRDEGAGQ